MHHPHIASILVGVAAALAIVCAFGLWIMTNAYERLHFSSVLTSFCTFLIVLAIWIDDPNWQARLKGLLIGIILFVMNSILSHSTARAIRIREDKHLDPRPEDKIPVITKENPTGVRASR